MVKLILASGSPRRKMFMDLFEVDYDVVPSDYEEDMTLDMPLPELVQELASGKAKDVAEKVKSGLVIGGDTVVAIDGKILGKPKSIDEAKAVLRRLSGSINTVYSGIAIVDAESGRCESEYTTTDVKFKKLSDEEIADYIATGEPMDKAGSYGMQGIGGIFIEKIEGCYSNVIGLSLPKLNMLLKKFNYNILKGKN